MKGSTWDGTASVAFARQYPLCRSERGQLVLTAPEAVIGYRIKTAHDWATAKLKTASLISTGNDQTLWTLCFNPTYTDSPSWTGNGCIEYATGGGVITDDGTVFDTGYISNDVNQLSIKLNQLRHIGMAIDGTRDEIWLTARPLSGSGSYVGSLTVNEVPIG